MKDLEKFLKERRAFSKFKRNLPRTFEKHVATTDRVDMILAAFSWDSTPEGHEYWRKINKEWTK